MLWEERNPSETPSTDAAAAAAGASTTGLNAAQAIQPGQTTCTTAIANGSVA